MLATEYEEFSIRKKKKLVPPQTRIRLDRWKDDDESRGGKEEWMEGDERCGRSRVRRLLRVRRFG